MCGLPNFIARKLHPRFRDTDLPVAIQGGMTEWGLPVSPQRLIYLSHRAVKLNEGTHVRVRTHTDSKPLCYKSSEFTITLERKFTITLERKFTIILENLKMRSHKPF